MTRDYISPSAQPIEPPVLWLIEEELNRLDVKTLAGYTLPLEPEHAARLLVRALGSASSGNHGHKGRPGQVGGSGGGGSKTPHADRLIEEFGTTTDPMQTGFLLPDGRRSDAQITEDGGREHKDMAGGSEKDLSNLLDEGAIRYVLGGGIEASVVPTDVQAQTIADDWNFIHKVPLFVDRRPEGIDKWSSDAVSHTFERPINPDAIRNWFKKSGARMLGSVSSGNFGHKGRPGQVGGSGGGKTSWDRWKNEGGWDVSHLSITVDGKKIGGADVQDTGDTLFIPFIHVDSEYQGKGHGKTLLLEIVREANKRGRTTISGESSSDSYRRMADKLFGAPVIHGDPDYYEKEMEGVDVVHTIPPSLRTLSADPSADLPSDPLKSNLEPPRTIIISGAGVESPQKSDSFSGLGARFSESPIHAAADAHVAKFSVTLRYAFAVGRKALQPMLATMRTAGSASSGNHGHKGRPGQVGGSGKGSDNPLRGQAWGEHTPEGQARLIAYLEKETGEKFTPHGSVAKGATSKNDFDIVMQPTTEADLERQIAESNQIEQDLHDKVVRGEMTEDAMMEELFGDYTRNNDPLTEPMRKIGFEHAQSVEFDMSPTGDAGDPEVMVTRYQNQETGHSIEVWIPLKTLGSAKSGNFGHKGRPGQVGGSGGRGLAARPTLDEVASDAVRAALERILPKLLHQVAVAGGKAGLEMLGDRLRTASIHALDDFTMRFDAQNLSVIAWAKRHAAELVTQITDTIRKRIRLAVTELQEDGDWDFAYDRILHAVGDENRADLIARHETMLAADEGQRQGWDQAVDAGLLPEGTRRVWIVTPDERLCPICAALEDKTAPLGGVYPGGFDGPPAHIQCRCTEGITG